MLCAPDSFKGTATAGEAAAAMAAGVRDAGAVPVEAPMADGGEGTAELLADAAGSAIRHDVAARDAAGRPATATWWDLGDGRAVLDVASASGLPAVSDVLDAPAASTYGTGEVIADALAHGIRHVTLCLGGSATTDGGAGIVAALGGRLTGGRPTGGDGVATAQSIATAGGVDFSGLDPRLRGVSWTLVTDVTTPPRDSARVFGPQKGATPEQVEQLTEVLVNWCAITGVDANAARYGAAGATPVGIAAISRAAGGGEPAIEPGAALVARETGVHELLPESEPAGVDLVLTGEGSVDGQSDAGKVVGHLLRRAASCTPPVPVHLVGGRVDRDSAVAARAAGATELPGPMSETIAGIRRAAREATQRYRP